MWPFARKEPKPKELEPPVAIGERFKYLGVEMVCTRHYEFDVPFPVVWAAYVNHTGNIVHARFPPCDWAALRAEIAR